MVRHRRDEAADPGRRSHAGFHPDEPDNCGRLRASVARQRRQLLQQSRPYEHAFPQESGSSDLPEQPNQFHLGAQVMSSRRPYAASLAIIALAALGACQKQEPEPAAPAKPAAYTASAAKTAAASAPAEPAASTPAPAVAQAAAAQPNPERNA
jgi:hypothetical protein